MNFFCQLVYILVMHTDLCVICPTAQWKLCVTTPITIKTLAYTSLLSLLYSILLGTIYSLSQPCILHIYNKVTQRDETGWLVYFFVLKQVTIS